MLADTVELAKRLIAAAECGSSASVLVFRNSWTTRRIRSAYNFDWTDLPVREACPSWPYDDRVRRSAAARRKPASVPARGGGHSPTSASAPGSAIAWYRWPTMWAPTVSPFISLRALSSALRRLRPRQRAGCRGNRVGPGDRGCLRPADRTHGRGREAGRRECRRRQRYRHCEFRSGPARVVDRLVVNMLDPEAIVLGGGLGLAAGPYRDRLIASALPTSGPMPAVACRSCRRRSEKMPA